MAPQKISLRLDPAIERRSATDASAPRPTRRIQSDRAHFAKLKAILQKAACKNHRTLEAAIPTSIDAFTPSECAKILLTRVQAGLMRKCSTQQQFGTNVVM